MTFMLMNYLNSFAFAVRSVSCYFDNLDICLSCLCFGLVGVVVDGSADLECQLFSRFFGL